MKTVRHPGESRGPVFFFQLKTWIPAFAGMTALVFLYLSSISAGDPIADFPQRVHKLTLKNGMRVLIVERPTSQTVSFAMYIRTGGVNDISGRSGLAHMFEHMLFKGTKTIGTKNYKKEEPLLNEIDKAQSDLQAEMDKGGAADKTKLGTLQQHILDLNKQHEELLVPEEYWQIYERAGGRELNASTGYDFTNYMVSLPLNAVNLWFAMEADRIKNPVLREFYKERSVVMEERRLRTDTSPQGRLWENFLAAAFMAHPYGRPIVGWESDISRVTRSDAEKFFKKHYDVSHLVVGIVGGIKTADVEALCHKYFEPIPSQVVENDDRISLEPVQQGERRVRLEDDDAESTVFIGYHRPDMRHPDEPALNVLEDLLGSGRTSRFNLDLVEKKKVAVSAWASASNPGERDPNLFMIGGSPRSPHTLTELENAIDDEIQLMKTQGPTELELEKVKNNLEANVIRGLSSNMGLATQLAYYESVAGDWNYLLELIKGIRAVTKTDVERVTKEYLVKSNRTVGMLVRKKA